MGRPPRIEYPGAAFHITTRGNDRQRIYFGNWSGRLFVRELERTARRFGWRVYAYCLMTNHYHLVLEIDEAGLSRGMRELNGRIARQTNHRLGRTNHLFGARFHAGLIEPEGHWEEACRYTLLNPIRADTGCPDPRRWRWSSLRATLGREPPPAFLDVRAVLGRFGRIRTPEHARVAFWQYLLDGWERRVSRE